ncbi:MAG: hypothetical protein CMK59_00345 [Proteobacteria bacterium]|nr:hypothetical protein [Pseudomonadota bacterium]
MNIVLVLIHSFVAACWLGSIFYSATILNPKTPLYLSDDESEEFLLKITHGNRYRILGSYSAVLLTGIVLLFLQRERLNQDLWMWIIVTKTLFSIAYICIFYWVSWVVYPWRIFASKEERPKYRRKNTILRWLMFSCVAICFVLGIALHYVS